MKRGPKVKWAYERFWKHVQKRRGCWLWTGHPESTGYGKLYMPKTRTWVQAHRYSWLLHHGPVPARKIVLHKCDNRLCVNPKHFKLGTMKKNTRDMIKKGRHRWDGAGVKKLSKKQRHSLMSAVRGGGSVRSLAKTYGVSKETVRYWSEKAVLR
jgi:hypothetical protein